MNAGRSGVNCEDAIGGRHSNVFSTMLLKRIDTVADPETRSSPVGDAVRPAWSLSTPGGRQRSQVNLVAQRGRSTDVPDFVRPYRLHQSQLFDRSMWWVQPSH